MALRYAPPIPNETRLTFGQAASPGRSVYLRDKLFVEVFSMWIRMLLDVPNVETRMSNLPSSPSEWVINLAFSIVESHSLFERMEETKERTGINNLWGVGAMKLCFLSADFIRVHWFWRWWRDGCWMIPIVTFHFMKIFIKRVKIYQGFKLFNKLKFTKQYIGNVYEPGVSIFVHTAPTFWRRRIAIQ